jgi:hypothetical protein
MDKTFLLFSFTMPVLFSASQPAPACHGIGDLLHAQSFHGRLS